jgi:hypothetical protein
MLQATTFFFSRSFLASMLSPSMDADGQTTEREQRGKQ